MHEHSPIVSRNILQQLVNLPLQQLLMIPSIAPTGKMLVDEYCHKLSETRALALTHDDALQRIYLDCMELAALYDFSTQLVNMPIVREMAQHEAAGDNGRAGKIDDALSRDERMFDDRAQILEEVARSIRSYSGDYAKDPKSVAQELRENLEDIFPGDFAEGIDLLVERTTELGNHLLKSEDCRALDLRIQQFLVRQAIPHMHTLTTSMRLGMAKLQTAKIENLPKPDGRSDSKLGFRMDASSVEAALADPNNKNVRSLFDKAQSR